MTRRIVKTATTAMAIVALAAPIALARPADMPPAVAKATAAESHKQARHPHATTGYPTRPAQGEQANPRPETPSQVLADPGVAWGMIGLGIAGLLGMAAIVGIASQVRRSLRGRIAA